MHVHVRNEKATVYANVAVHADVDIKLVLHGGPEDGAAIHIGPDGPDLRIDFADVESLGRLAEVATDGVRQLREQEAGAGQTDIPTGEKGGPLVGSGAA